MSCKNLHLDPDPDPVGSVCYWHSLIRIRILSNCWIRIQHCLKSRTFFLFGPHFDCPGSGSIFLIRIWIQGSHFNRDPHGSGSEKELSGRLFKPVNQYLQTVNLYFSVPTEFSLLPLFGPNICKKSCCFDIFRLSFDVFRSPNLLGF